MSDSNQIDTRALRNAFGAFATGVTIITTRGADGKDYGLTANSFSSVSLEPPLLLWCLGDKTDCFDAFQQADHYAIHVLAEDQQNLSNQFASKGADKFAGIDCERGPGGTPLLPHYLARFVCRGVHKYDGGDHVIHVGEIVDFSEKELEPLLFHKGKYRELS